MTQLDLQQKLEQAETERDALQQQVNALAAENLALTGYLKECAVVQGEGNWTSDNEKSVYVPAFEWMPPTPATDAIKRQWMAEGVTVTISQAFREGIPVSRMEFIAKMAAFAAQLRQPEEKGHE